MKDEPTTDFEDFSDLAEVMETIPSPTPEKLGHVCSFCGNIRSACIKNDALPLEATVQEYTGR